MMTGGTPMSGNLPPWMHISFSVWFPIFDCNHRWLYFPKQNLLIFVGLIDDFLTFCNSANVATPMPFLPITIWMVCTSHLWWYWGWFMDGLPHCMFHFCQRMSMGFSGSKAWLTPQFWERIQYVNSIEKICEARATNEFQVWVHVSRQVWWWTWRFSAVNRVPPSSHRVKSHLEWLELKGVEFSPNQSGRFMVVRFLQILQDVISHYFRTSPIKDRCW